ncbi:multidrug efflux system subunit MdtA [Yersinia enterocolitica]|nr:multidrug efflux system subunit MdtA [Yersinia enterocolitica]
MLFPNQFVNARIKVDLLQNAVVVPTAAVQMGNEGSFVWTLNDENKVSKHLVTTGIQDSKQVVISAGLDAGQRVVTDGIDRLTEGLQVEVVTPRSADTAPTDAAEKPATADKATHRRGGKPATDTSAGSTTTAAEKS